MALHLKRPVSPRDGESPASPGNVLQQWLGQVASLAYLVGGLFLLYQYWAHLRRQVVLVTGVLFVVYSIYRFFLVRRSASRR